MKSKFAAAALIAAVASSAFAAEPYWTNVDNGFDRMIYAQKDNAAYWDNVQTSFGNMLNHAPYYGPTATTIALGKPDSAEALIHAMVRGDNPPALAQKGAPYFDNVAASFGHMIAHTPHTGETGVTVARQLDHRVDRIVFALSLETKGPAMMMASGESESVVK